MNEYTVRVTCDCRICETNAERVGAAFPLAAAIRPIAAKGMGITARNFNQASKVHGIVYFAHDPSLAAFSGPRLAIPA